MASCIQSPGVEISDPVLHGQRADFSALPTIQTLPTCTAAERARQCSQTHRAQLHMPMLTWDTSSSRLGILIFSSFGL